MNFTLWRAGAVCFLTGRIVYLSKRVRFFSFPRASHIGSNPFQATLRSGLFSSDVKEGNRIDSDTYLPRVNGEPEGQMCHVLLALATVAGCGFRLRYRRWIQARERTWRQSRRRDPFRVARVH